MNTYTGNVFIGAWHWLTTGDNWFHNSENDGVIPLAWAHIQIAFWAVLIGAVIGLTIGVALGHFRRGAAFVTVLANVTRAIPTLAILILLSSLPAFGVSTKTAIISLGAFAIPPILTNSWAGVASVDRDTVEAARGLGMTGSQILRRVELPLALPLIAAGVRSSALQTFATATIASFLGNSTLGNLVQIGQANANDAEVLGAAFIIGIVAILLDQLLAALQRSLTPKSARKPYWFTRQSQNVIRIAQEVG
jgi:osmoprotectant transport system permease protein